MAWHRVVLAFLIGTACSLSSSRASAQVQQLWHRDGQIAGQYWRSVACGTQGSQILSNVDGGGGAVTLFSAGDSVAAPVIWSDGSGATGRFGLVASARDADFHVDLAFTPQAAPSTLLVPTLRGYRSTASGSVWTRQFAAAASTSVSLPAGLHVSDQGSRVVAWWYDVATIHTRVVVVDADGNVLFDVTLWDWVQPRASALSADGSRLFMNVAGGVLSFDTTTGIAANPVNGWAPPTHGLAISPAGDVVAFGNQNGGIDVLHSTGGGPLTYAFAIAGPTTHAANVLALSRDGTVLAAGYSGTTSLHSHKLRVIDMVGPAHAILHEETIDAPGDSTFLTDIVCTQSGDGLAVGTTGDAQNVLPELIVMQRLESGTWTRTNVDLPGSVYDLDLSRNSRTLAVASASSNLNNSPAWAAVDAYDLGSDLSYAGVPHANAPLVFTEVIQPLHRCMLLRGDALLATPVSMIGMGGLLQVQSPVVVGIAGSNAQGIAHISYTVPGALNDIGRSYFFQGLCLSNRRLSKDWTVLTVVP